MGPAADTLDDGEAATIAYAHAVGTVALIDEKKAWRICAARFPNLAVHTTVDILTSAHVTKLLGQGGVGDAVFKVLSVGRMRVPPADYQRVVKIIGVDRAKLCTSLPEAHPLSSQESRRFLMRIGLPDNHGLSASVTETLLFLQRTVTRH